MTALHQAAQKAVERIRHTLMTGLAHNDAIAALSEIVAMLPQHPDPETRPSMSMFASAADYNAAMDEWLTPPALQHQEVPREPVAADAKSILEQVANAPNEENCAMCNGRGFYGIPGQRCSFCKGTGRVQWRSAPDAASPSTTRQQEVGSAEAWDFTCWRRELVYLIENHYDASDAAKHRTMEAITEHVDAAGMHWRAVTALRDIERRAAAPSTPAHQNSCSNSSSTSFDARGVQAVAPVQPLPGVETLRNVIECLRADARYVDEEGEATDQLQDLLDALRAPGVAMPWKPPPYPATPTEREALAKRRAALGVKGPDHG